MGQRGPAPKPAAARKKDGTFRADRHGVGSLPVEVPVAPADLAPRARAFWDVVTKELFEAGYIAKLDRQILRQAADSWAVYLEAMDSIEKKGVVVESVTKYGVVLKANPACVIRDRADKQIKEVLTKFGMTPAARNNLYSQAVTESDEKSQEVAEILCFPGA